MATLTRPAKPETHLTPDGKIDLTRHAWANPVIEVWRRDHPGRRGTGETRATIRMYCSDGGKTFVVYDGRPYGHVSGSDRYLLAATVEEARRNYARLRDELKAERYYRVGLV